MMLDKQAGRTNTRVEEISQRLREIATSKGPNAQLPTIRVLCETLNTTRVTLSEALDQLEAENILYRKERQGIFVSPKIHSRCIDILLNRDVFTDYSASPFWSLLWMHLLREIKKREHIHNEIFNIQLIKEKEFHILPEETIADIRSRRLDGCMCISFNMKESSLVTEGAIPCVTFAGNGPWIVSIDGEEMARNGVTALIKQGCRRIGLWMFRSPSSIETSSEYIGYTKTLSEHRLPLQTELIQQPKLPISHMYYDRALSFQDQGYLIAKEVFSLNNKNTPDGIFVPNDLMTDGILVAFDELGIEVGRDVKIATLANAGSPILFGRTQHMSAILEIDAADIAHAMFYTLDMLINKHHPPEQIFWIKAKLRS